MRRSPASGTDSPPRPVRRHHHGDLRAALIAAALSHVRTHGAASFSLRDATKGACVTSAAAYRHFTSRADVLEEVAVLGFERLSRTMHERSGHLEGVQRLIATGEAYVAFAHEEPLLFTLMFSHEGAAGRKRSFEMEFEVPNAADQLRHALEAANAKSDGVTFLRAWALAHGLASLAAAGVQSARTSGHDAIAAFASTVSQDG